MGEVTPGGADVYAETSRRRVTGQPALQWVRRAGPSGVLLEQGCQSEEGKAGESVLGKERWLRLGRLGLCPRDALIIKCQT